MQSQSNQGLRRYWPLLLFMILGALTGAWHNRAVRQGRADPVSGSVRAIIAPPAAGLKLFSAWVGKNIGWIFRGRSLASENARLKMKVAELQNENVTLQEASIENLSLKKDLGFISHRNPAPIPARVIGMNPDPDFNTILVNKGSDNGVKPHSVVESRSGLVGQTLEVGPTTSTVLLLTDPNGMAGGRVQRAASRAVGICHGNYSSLLSFVDLPNDADIRPGDKIITSGFGVFPSGVLIGTVQSVKMTPGQVSKSARIVPAVGFNRLEVVYLMR